jgi:hypothetical protein
VVYQRIHRLKSVPLKLNMKKKRFKSELLSGHKESAIEVPFDPAEEWHIDPQPLWRGRRGHSVHVVINRVFFESAIVPRQKKFYLLIDAEAAKSAGISSDGLVEVAVEPCPE